MSSRRSCSSSARTDSADIHRASGVALSVFLCWTATDAPGKIEPAFAYRARPFDRSSETRTRFIEI